MKLRFWTGSSAATFFLLAGCGIQVVPSGSPGALTPPQPGEPTASHHIRYEVRCQRCMVCYMSPDRACEGEVRGMWAKEIRVVGTDARQVWLEATPAGDDDWIQRARILLDGEAVAEFDGDRKPRPGETVFLSAGGIRRGIGGKE